MFRENIYDEVLTQMGNSICSVRSSRGLSQRDLSRLSGVSQCDISRYEDGGANICLSTLKRIASVCRCRLTLTLREVPV